MDLGIEGGFCFGFSITDGSCVCGSCGSGFVSRIGIEAVKVVVPLLLGFVCKYAFGSWVSSRTALTLWRVLRLGFNAGLLVVIQLSLCLIKDFPMSFASLVLLVSISPCSFVYRHSIARAVPTERSLPVGQDINIFPGVGVGRAEKKYRSRGSWVRRSRDPSLFVWHLRCK